MILTTLDITPDEFAAGTGWVIKPQGACKAELCVPLPPMSGERFDVRVAAGRIGMPLVHDDESGLWCLGPEAGGRALSSAVTPDVVLPDWRGNVFHLDSLRGTKVLLLAWASW